MRCLLQAAHITLPEDSWRWKQQGWRIGRVGRVGRVRIAGRLLNSFRNRSMEAGFTDNLECPGQTSKDLQALLHQLRSSCKMISMNGRNGLSTVFFSFLHVESNVLLAICWSRSFPFLGGLAGAWTGIGGWTEIGGCIGVSPGGAMLGLT